MDSKKGGLALLILGHGGGGKMEHEHGDDEGADEGVELHEIAQELLDAVKADDARAVADALRGAFACLEAEGHDEGDGEEGY